MRRCEYISVHSSRNACAVLAEYGSSARLLAGGTDLLIEFRHAGANVPKVLVDISHADDLHGIEESGGMILIKPLVTHTQLLKSPILHKYAPLLAVAASTIGSPQIRNRGTVGGNVMNAAACADTLPPLVALRAQATLLSKSGLRTLPISELFLKPYQTAAREDEILAAIRFPQLGQNAGSAFIKLGRRNALSISRLSVAAILSLGDGGRIVDARIVPGAAFPTWQRVSAAEEMLLGEKPSEKLFATAGKKVADAMIACTGRRWSTEYKEPVIAALVKRALLACGERTSSLPAESTSSHPGTKPLDIPPVQSKSNECTITATVNNRRHSVTVPVNCTLLEFLRDHLGLTGTKCGCEIGECGACTVLLDGVAVNSCLVLAPQIDGRDIRTVEGLAGAGTLDPLQESFMDHDAVHCGFCTSGMLMSAQALLNETSHPSEQETRTAISGNLCRCTGYVQIVEAIHHMKAKHVE